MLRVCKTTFLNSLNISDKSIRTAYRKLECCPSLADQRGLYVRKTYCTFMAVSIFNTEFDLKFNDLQNDACDACTTFKNADNKSKLALKPNHEEHLALKKRSRERKIEHKLAAHSSAEINASVFDFQKGIQLPKTDASSFYYKRKLIVHNFTIYDLSSKDAYNYVYDESLTGLGPNEVTSFLNMFMLAQMSKGVKEFRFLSDNCGGQNKNQYVFTFYAYFSAKHSVDISHTFLISGHTQNEGDSVHAVIERSFKKTTLYTTPQVIQSIKTARKTQPYHVIEVDLQNLYDFKVLATKNRITRNTEKESVKITEIKEINISHKDPYNIRYRYDFDSDFKDILLLDPDKESFEEPCVLRKEAKGISLLKKRDLESLCKANLVPNEHKLFFDSLKVESVEPAKKNQKLS